MSLLASLLRLRADASGNAIRTSHVRHLHLSDQPLMVLPLRPCLNWLLLVGRSWG